MRASSLALTVLAGLGLLSCVGSAQDPPAGSSGLGPRNVATPGTTTSSEPAVAETVAAPNVTQPPFFAGLLVLESNWSESPNARAIVDDLLKLESGAGQPSLDQGPQWLFPSTHAVFFAPQEFEQLSAWLKEKELIKSYVRFEAPQPDIIPGGEVRATDLTFRPSRLRFPEGTAPSSNRQNWSWTLGTIQPEPGGDSAAQLQRRLFTEVENLGGPRGERAIDEAAFQFRFLKNHVAVIRAFPLERDQWRAREYASHRNAFPLIVVYDSQLQPGPFHTAEETIAGTSETISETARLCLPVHMEVLGEVLLPSAQDDLTTPARPQTPKYVSGGDIIVSWNPEFTVVWGFSQGLGHWTRQDLHATGSDYPVVSTAVAAVRVGDTFYGYSGTTGRWDVLKTEYSGAQFSVDKEVIMVHAGPKVYTFAASSGRWTSPDDAGAAGGAATSRGTLHVLELRNYPATMAVRIVEQMFPDDATVMAVTSTSEGGSVVLRTRNERVFEEIAALLSKLDEPVQEGTSGSNTILHGAGTSYVPEEVSAADLARDYGSAESESADYGVIVVDTSAGVHQPKVFVRRGALVTTFASMQACVDWARQGFEYNEQLALRTADEIRSLRERRGASSPDNQERLSAVVRRAFAWRQRLQQAETAALRLRLAQIENNIRSREHIKGAIIDRRVQDLLDPLRQWEAPPATSSSSPR